LTVEPPEVTLTDVNRALAISLIVAAVSLPLSAAAFSVSGFQNPYGVAVDQKTGFIYVSNVNGTQIARDDNGFISRLKGDGTIDQLRFIDAASKQITLHAPKGMAIRETTLYVADIDKLHAFDLNTGKLLFDVNFGDLPVQHFYDVVLGPDDALYVTDGPANIVYRVDVPRMHEVTTFISGGDLGQPHGICWYAPRQVFLVAGWSSGQLLAFDRAGKRQPLPAILLRTLEGVATADLGNIYVASASLSAVYRVAPNFGLNSFGLGIVSPAGVAFHKAGNDVVVASFDGNTVQSLPVPPPQ